MENQIEKEKKRDRSNYPIIVAVSASFLLAIVVSIGSLTLLARENTKEIDKMLAYRIYDFVYNSLNEPIVVSKTMSSDDFLVKFLNNEREMDEAEAVETMQSYLGNLKKDLGYDSVFLVSEKSRRYYTYEGLNKIVDPENDDHDIWYSIFVDSGLPYDLDVDSDEVNNGVWTVFVNARIVDENGDLLGVCGVGVQMTSLQELINTCEQEYDVKVNFVDESGLVQIDTEDINIEKAQLDIGLLGEGEKDEYVYQDTDDNEFAVTKYVEYLDWYLVVRSAPTSISSDFVSIIILNAILFLIMLAVLIFMIVVILRRLKRGRDEREALLIASERAVAANEAKSSFLSSMSHEIRTPINAVLGMNEMILRGTEDKKILEYSSNIQTAGRTLLSLINSILDFSKIEEGKMEIVPVVYETVPLINHLVASVSERAKSKGLELLVDIDEMLPRSMIGDDVRISQVILNILTNAVKYTEEGHVKLIIRAEKSKGKNVDLYVAVEDTGIGIRKEDLPKLFSSFERLDEEKNHHIEGTGLGMSIVTNLLRMMESEIKVKSEYGVGSTFYFTLHQIIEDDTPIGDYKAQKEIDLKQEDETLRAEGARILVVDDNEMNLKVTANLLGLYGITPKNVSSGFEALSCLQKESFHMILLDHMMPKMDGTETLHRMKEEGLLPKDTKVIVLTANAISGAREEYLAEGFDDYLSKPVELPELRKILKKWLPEDLLQQDDAKKNEKDEDAGDVILEFMPWDDTEYEQKKEESEDVTDRLATLGFDTKAAITYCGGDEGFYKEMLFDYMEAYADKKNGLEESFKGENWPEFAVQIHALKSTSKTIGAIELSEQAFEMEKAAKEERAEYIKENWLTFAIDYEKTVGLVKEALEGEKDK